jgi:NADH-quinone oxidoreductase subunit E
MNLPPQLETKFQTLENRYPVKRSALIPMLIYAQDQFGYVSDEMIGEIAAAWPEYAASHRDDGVLLDAAPPARRKIHVQVCTNVSCMLRGGNKLYEFVQKKLEIGHKETTEDGVFSLEEVECMGACTGAPAMQVNYDFYENLTTERTTQIFEALEAGRTPETSVPISGSVKKRHPAEVPVISRLFGVKDSHKLDVYLANDGYKGHGARAQGIDARAGRRRSERSRICADAAARAFPPA